MKQELEVQTAVWLQNAYKTANEYSHEEILPLHLYYSILTDDTFCGSLWKSAPKIQQEFLEFLITNLQKIDPTLDCDEHPVMSAELADVISCATSYKKPGETPLSSEILFKTLLNEKPLFTAKPQRLLLNLATEKIRGLCDRSEHIASIKDTLDHSFFLNFNASISGTSISVSTEKTLTPRQKLALKIPSLKEELEKVVFGQTDAIEAVGDTLTIVAANFERENKTSGSFVFHGPTGCGKTELAREIALELGIPLLKFDMSEYMEAHSISKFIGSPPGYVGNGEGGRLIKKVKATPHCVVLLDEYEKAHRNFDSLLLQVMDDGVLTDGRGVEADFSNVILIMTSNAGAREGTKLSAGFGTGIKDQEANAEEAIKNLFSPEFRNRLDGSILFKDVKNTVMPKIVGKFVDEFQSELDEKSLVGEFTAAAMDHLIDLGRKSEFGPRDVKRLIEKKIKSKVALAFIKGELPEGSHVFVDVDADNKLSVELDVNHEETQSLLAIPFINGPDSSMELRV